MKKRSFLSPYIYPGLKMAHGLHREIKEQSKSLQFSLSKDEVLKIISEEQMKILQFTQDIGELESVEIKDIFEPCNYNINNRSFNI